VRDDRQRLLGIVEAVEKIEQRTAEGREAFDADELVQVWILHDLRGLACHRRPADAGALARWARPRALTLPVIEINHTVCREDLLFEIELDARTTRAQTPPTPTGPRRPDAP
jgi:hypothetical protein